MSFNSSHNKNFQTSDTTKSKKPAGDYVPNIDEFQKTVSSILQEQIDAFYEDHLPQLQCVKNPSKDFRLETANRLFNLPNGGSHLGSYPCTIEGFEDHEIYMLERTCRISPKTFEFIRASISAVVLIGGRPRYFISGFVNAGWKGNVVVCPIDDDGPVYRDTYRVNIVKDPNVGVEE